MPYIFFIIFPLLELWVFVETCGEIGFFTALLLLILAGVIGGAVVRQQGFQTVLALHDAFDRGKMPLNELFDGFCIVAAGLLLIFPGFISDVLAILLLVPRLRMVLRGFVAKHPKWTQASANVVIEGEYERVEDDIQRLK